MDTGFKLQDAQSDFARLRRERVLHRLASRLRGERGDVDVILPFEEVVDALGRVSERQLGLQQIPLDAIVGSVGRTRDFDRSFRPVSQTTRPRWERIATALRRGEEVPPISVYKVGELYFVRDGHHRVSVARALGRTHIDAYVTEVITRVGTDGGIRLGDLPLKNHERVFLERVPLPPEARSEVHLSDPWAYAALAEGVEAWGFRHCQAHGVLKSREEVAQAWLEEDFRPIVRELRECGLVQKGTAADAYMRVVNERYRLMRTHEWGREILDRLMPSLR